MLVSVEPVHRKRHLPFSIGILTMVCYGLLHLMKASDFERSTFTTIMFKSVKDCNYTQDDPEYSFFLRAWCLQQQYRFDWEYVLSPCFNQTTWSAQKNYWGEPNITTAARSFISLRDIRPAGQFSRFFIRSVAYDGTLKTEGGDFWRVHVKGSTSSVPVTTIDHKNGTYEVIFLIVDPGLYKAEIYLDYTLCDGLKDPPRDWIAKGNAQGKYQPPDALPGREMPFLIEPLLPHPIFNISLGERDILKGYLSKGQICVEADSLIILKEEVHDLGLLRYSCPKPKCLMLNSFGRWRHKKWRPYVEDTWNKWPVKGKRDILWIYGDSVGDFLYRSIIKRKLCTSVFSKCEHTYNWIYRLKNNNITRAKLETDQQDFRIERVLFETDGALRDKRMNRHSAIILNYGLHYVEGISFNQYRKLIDSIVTLIKKHREDSKGFHGKIIWKTTTALFKERYGHPRSNARHAKGLRFLTVPRVLLYNAYATSAMCQAGIDVIDVYPMSDSYPAGTGSPHKTWDAVHYRDEAFRAIEDFLEHYFSPRG